MRFLVAKNGVNAGTRERENGMESNEKPITITAKMPQSIGQSLQKKRTRSE